MAVRNRKVILRPGLPPIPPAAPAPKKKAPPRARRKRKPKPPKPKRKLKRAKKRTLAKRPKKTTRTKQRKPADCSAAKGAPRAPAVPRRRDDQWRLEQMGLAALVVPKSAPREVVKAKRPCANKGADWSKPAGSRVYDAILRVMEPGKLYRMGDIRDASGLHTNHVKGYVQAVMPDLGLVEKVDAKAVARRAGPLVAERLRGYRNLWRLTERGIAEAQAVAEADRRGGGYPDEGEAA